jgi:hypothetical protein
MKKSSLKNYIAFLEAAAAANATDHWMRQYELKDKELLKAKDEIAELKRRLLEVSPTHRHNHNFERNHNGTQA